MEETIDRPYIKYEWIINDGARFVVYCPNGKRKVFDTRGEAEGFIIEWLED